MKQANRNMLDAVADLIGEVWNGEHSGLALVYGGVGWVAGEIAGTDPLIRFGNNAIEFLRNPLNVSAITLGNTINYGPFDPNDPSPESPFHTVGQHELQHTYQGQTLGPFFLPSAALSLGLGSVVNGNSHGPASFMERGPQSDPPHPW